MRKRAAISILAILIACLGTGCTTAPGAAFDPVAQLHVRARFAGPDGGWDFTTFDPVLRRVYVSRFDGVTALDVDSGAVTAHVVNAVGTHIAVPINGGTEILVTSASAGGALIANARTGEVRVPRIVTGKHPDAAFVEPTTGMVWVLDNAGGGIALVDPRTGAVTATIATPGKLESPATDGAGKVFITVEDEGEVIAVDAAHNTVISHFKLSDCEEPGGLALARSAGRLIVACANLTSKIVDANTGGIVASLPIGPQPDVAIYDPARKLAFIPTGGDARMTVIDPVSAKVVGTVATAQGARSIAIDEKTDTYYLPSAKFGPPPSPGARPQLLGGTFEIIAVRGGAG